MTKANFKGEDQAWDVDDEFRDGDIASVVEVHVGG